MMTSRPTHHRLRFLTHTLTTAAGLLAVLGLVAAMTACDDEETPGGADTDTDTLMGDTTAGDTSPGDTTADTVEPSAVSFVIENTGTDTVYLQSGLSSWGWINVRNASGDLLRTSWDCGLCECGETACPVCDIAPPSALALEAGEEQRFDWDGRVWTVDEVEQCSIVEAAPPGSYEATFCWGNATTGDEAGFQTFIAGMQCATQSFVIGTDSEVRQEASVSGVPDGVTLTLENGSAAPIFYQAVADDCSGDPGWYTIADDTGAALDLFADCGTCACVYGPDCVGGCDAACRAPEAPELAVGASHDTAWSGLVPVEKTLAPGWTCIDHEPAPAGPLTARVCWGTSRTGDASGSTIENETCDTAEFTLGVDTSVTVSSE